MSTKTKNVVLLIAAQTGCLAVGLWMHDRLAVSSAVHQANESAWRGMQRRGTGLLEELAPRSHVDRQAPPEHGRVVAALTGSPFMVGQALIVNARGVPIWSSTDERPVRSDGGVDAASTRAPLVWRAIPAESPGTAESSWGIIAFGDGDHLAVAFNLVGGDRLILHQSVERVRAQTLAALQSLPVVSVIALVWIVALLGITAYVILTRVHEQMEQERLGSTTEALRQTQDLARTRDAVIFGLAKLADSRDPETGDHLERISVYSTTLASALRRNPRYRDEVTPAFVRLIGISSALHDIGKVGVADSILRKSGPLTATEHEAMRIHTSIGGKCLSELEHRLGGSNFLQMARRIAYAHHENWDGSGYPKGLSGEQIPLAARIVAIADVYDALSSRRVYKDRMAHRKCVEIITRGAGKKFDPALVEVWLTVLSQFESVAKQFAFRAGDELPDDEPDIAEPESRDECEALCAIGAGPQGAWG